MTLLHGTPRLWRTPEVSSVGRLPMVASSTPYPDVASARAGGRSPWVRSLDGDWRFRLLDRPESAPVDWADVGHDDAAWDTMAVPGNWAMAGFDRPAYQNILMPFAGDPPDVPDENPCGIYRRVVSLPATWLRRRTILTVGAAESVVIVAVNGVEVGLAKDSRLPSRFDVTDHLVPGVNTVAMAVIQWSDASWIEDQDQWWLAGIHRSVTLTSVGRVALDDVATVGGLDLPSTGTVDVSVSVTGPAEGWVVRAQVETLAGRVLTSGQPRLVPTHGTADPLTELISATFHPGQRVSDRLEVPSVRPWSHEDPHRYRVVVELLDRTGRVVEARSHLVGFRHVEVADNELRINGAPVTIWGVNHHEHHDRLGRAVPLDTLRLDLETMKCHHVNAVRAAHYPHQEAFAELCDELGLYVIDEANVESHARQAEICVDPRYLGAIVERGVRMVLRDRNHPSVILWSLGNESGDGPAHAAMAAAIRTLDPSRPLHYEGALMHDLYAEAATTDVVCPMYSEIDAIVAWAKDDRDTRRPLIMCEYSHAMGNSNGSLADYAAAFETHHGLQGGFIWEWLDHGIAQTAADGRDYWAYGGDFGEADRWRGHHDANFCCDGLVWPDRTPHPAMAEFAALAQPARVKLDGGRLVVENRRWFSGLEDLRCRWELAVDGSVVERGELVLPPVPARGSVRVAAPTRTRPAGGEAVLTFRFVSRRRPEWAPSGWQVAWSQVSVPTKALVPTKAPAATSDRTPARRGRRSPPISMADEGLVVGERQVGWPEASLFRAPTDNDGLRTGWLTGIGARGRWLRQGLDRLVMTDASVRRTSTGFRRTVTWSAGVGLGGSVIGLVHRQRIERVDADDSALRIIDEVVVPPEWRDPPRVGVTWTMPDGWTDLAWFGLGPQETYPDRCLAPLGLFRSSIRDQYVPYVVPQEHGHHHDTRWFELSGAGVPTVRVTGDRPLGFSALHHTVDDLASARHTIDLPDRAEVELHLDAAMRGLGTASCGPDVLPAYRIPVGRHRWAWTIAVR